MRSIFSVVAFMLVGCGASEVPLEKRGTSQLISEIQNPAKCEGMDSQLCTVSVFNLDRELKKRGMCVAGDEWMTCEEAQRVEFDAEDESLMEEAHKALESFSVGRITRERALERQKAALDRLYLRGICWGREDEDPADYSYFRCGPDNARMIESYLL